MLPPALLLEERCSYFNFFGAKEPVQSAPTKPHGWRQLDLSLPKSYPQRERKAGTDRGRKWEREIGRIEEVGKGGRGGERDRGRES